MAYITSVDLFSRIMQILARIEEARIKLYIYCCIYIFIFQNYYFIEVGTLF
jgi:hypothetical protein